MKHLSALPWEVKNSQLFSKIYKGTTSNRVAFDKNATVDVIWLNEY